MQTIEHDIRQFLTNGLGRDVANVAADTSLLEAGLLDSVAVIALVDFVGRHFNVDVTEDDMVPENFDSIAAIVTFVEGRRIAADA